MENKELEVGMSTRVWQPVNPVWLFEDVIKLSSQYIEDGELSHEHQPYLMLFDGEQGCAFAFDYEVKLIGKLTITKLK